MKRVMKKSAIAMAIGSVVLCGSALAETISTVDKTVTATETIGLNNQVSVSLEKQFNVTKDVYFLFAAINPNLDHAAVALVDNKQISGGNIETSVDDVSYAGSENSHNEDSGNIQVNLASGNNNQQDNAAIISVDNGKDDGNGGKTGGAADAETVVFQAADSNISTHVNGDNYSGLTDSARNSAGNLQFNLATGSMNQQKNALAIAVAENSMMSETTAVTLQESTGNITTELGGHRDVGIYGSVLGVTGNVQLNFAAGTGNQQANSLAIATK